MRTQLLLALASSGRKTLIIAGFSTEAVVLHSVMGAINAGYHVYGPVDACGGMSERTEAAAIGLPAAFDFANDSERPFSTVNAPACRSQRGAPAPGVTTVPRIPYPSPPEKIPARPGVAKMQFEAPLKCV
jgi:hypothetical protein